MLTRLCEVSERCVVPGLIVSASGKIDSKRSLLDLLGLNTEQLDGMVAGSGEG